MGILADRDEEGYLLQLFTKIVQDRPTLSSRSSSATARAASGTGTSRRSSRRSSANRRYAETSRPRCERLGPADVAGRAQRPVEYERPPELSSPSAGDPPANAPPPATRARDPGGRGRSRAKTAAARSSPRRDRTERRLPTSSPGWAAPRELTSAPGSQARSATHATSISMWSTATDLARGTRAPAQLLAPRRASRLEQDVCETRRGRGEEFAGRTQPPRAARRAYGRPEATRRRPRAESNAKAGFSQGSVSSR